MTVYLAGPPSGGPDSDDPYAWHREAGERLSQNTINPFAEVDAETPQGKYEQCRALIKQSDVVLGRRIDDVDIIGLGREIEVAVQYNIPVVLFDDGNARWWSMYQTDGIKLTDSLTEAVDIISASNNR